VLLVLGIAASCAPILGDVFIEEWEPGCTTSVVGGIATRVCPEQPGADTGEALGSGLVCEVGRTRCEGRVLQHCPKGTGWITIQGCATPALCSGTDLATVTQCLRPACGADRMSCDQNVLRQCNEDRTGWEVFDTCETAAHCDAGQRGCLPAPCDPGARRCNLGKLERCNDTRTGWEELAECVTDELCEATLSGLEPLAALGDGDGPTECLPPTCVSNQVQCDPTRPNQLLACVEGLTGFALAEECATPALCEASITYTGLRGSPRCKRAPCEVGEHHCSGKVLEICNDNRDGFRPIEECAGPSFCNAGDADRGERGCAEVGCAAGAEHCDGAQRQRCRDDQLDFDPLGAPCDSSALCNDDNPAASFCVPPPCQRGPLSANEFRCDGATLQRCNDQHTGYDTIDTCATAALCNAGLGSEGCIPPPCVQGQTRCDGNVLRRCNDDRTGFVNVSVCAPGTCDGNAGRCADLCDAGSARCNTQGELEECRDPAIGRQVTARCLSPQLCDANTRSCRSPPAGCTADGVRVCAPQADGSTLLQVCAGGRSRFDTLDTCTGNERCDPSNIRCDLCDQAGQATCQDGQLVRCAPDGQSTNASPCANGCQSLAGAPARCLACQPGSATCQSTDLLVCVVRGASGEFLERQACGSSLRCADERARCEAGQPCRCEVCDDQDVGCDGSFPTRCNAAHTALERVPGGNGGFVDCLASDNCNPSTGTCFPCNDRDVSCVGGVLQGCRLDRSGFDPIPGATAGGVRCTADNGRAFSQQCSGTMLIERLCEPPSQQGEGLCDPNVSGGCVECIPGSPPSQCQVTADGRPGRTECIAGVVAVVACASATSGCEEATCTGAGECVFRSRARGASCVRAGGVPGFCDGLQSGPGCIECVEDSGCSDDGNRCTEASCSPNGSCIHVPVDVGCLLGDGQAGICSNGACVEECEPNQGQCQGANFRRCNAEGTGFGPSLDCGAGALCSAAGCAPRCRAEDCGDVGCNSSETACNACSTNLCAALIAPGPCEEAVCASATTCRAQTLCQTGEVCDPQTNQCEVPPAQVCVPGLRRCDGAALQLCDEAGTSEATEATCGVGGGPCQAPNECSAEAGACVSGPLLDGQACGENGTCVGTTCQDNCGNGTCAGPENNGNCPLDCPDLAGDLPAPSFF
jgi:hypothetical protein